MAKKILLIEDDSFLSEIYVAKFQESGFEVLIAHDGAVGLQKIKEHAPDMILLDVVMPNMDGFEILQAVKEDPIARHIPVVILSNLGEKENITKGLGLGAVAYIVKAHHTPTEVVAKVEEILSKLEK